VLGILTAIGAAVVIGVLLKRGGGDRPATRPPAPAMFEVPPQLVRPAPVPPPNSPPGIGPGRSNPPARQSTPAASAERDRERPTAARGGATGLLRVTALPVGEVLIDGRPAGETPLEVRLGVGPHTVRVRFSDSNGRSSAPRMVQVHPSEVARVFFEPP
jgi:hypothetical protein